MKEKLVGKFHQLFLYHPAQLLTVILEKKIFFLVFLRMTDLTDAEAHAAFDRHEAEGGITDKDLNSALQSWSDRVSSLRRTYGRRREGGPPPRPLPPLRYNGPGAETDYPTILDSELYIDNLDANPAVWGLGVASPGLRHEQEWLWRIAPPTRRERFRLEHKIPLFRGGRVAGVAWKGKFFAQRGGGIWEENGVPFTMLHYQGQPGTAVYISGRARRVFDTKIW